MLILYRIYQFCFAFPLLLVLTIVTALVTGFGSIIFRGTWWGYYPPHLWSRAFCILSLVKVRIHGRENITENRSYVFIANHQGAYDIFAIYGYLGHRFKWMMKKSLEKMPFIGFACRCAGQIFVDNSSSAAVLRTMHEAESQLRDGISLVVFPEGSRTYTGKMGRFNRGAYQLSREFSMPLVPVTIDGAFEVLPRTAILPRYGTINLIIHRPVPAPETDAAMAEVMKKTFDTIKSGLPERYK